MRLIRMSLWIVLAGFLAIVLYQWVFGFQNHIELTIQNKSGGVVEGAELRFFDGMISVPKLEPVTSFQAVIDIRDKTGESSISFHYAGESQLPPSGDSSTPAGEDKGITLAGYIEGGQNKLYRGKIKLTLLPDRQSEVSVKKPLLSIL